MGRGAIDTVCVWLLTGMDRCVTWLPPGVSGGAIDTVGVGRDIIETVGECLLPDVGRCAIDTVAVCLAPGMCGGVTDTMGG